MLELRPNVSLAREGLYCIILKFNRLLIKSPLSEFGSCGRKLLIETSEHFDHL